MIELSVAGPLLAKGEQTWQVRARTKQGVEIRSGTFRQMAVLLMNGLKVESEELEAAVCFMLDNDHDVAFFDANKKCSYTYDSKTRKRMDE